MKLRVIQSLALLLWGWQSDLLLFAMPMAIIWETRFFLNRRWALTQKDFYLLADLTAVSLLLTVAFLFINRADYHFISTLMQWLPIVFFPLVVTVGYSTKEQLNLDVLFYSLRRQKQPVTQSWDMDYFLFGFLIVASGTSKELGLAFFPIASALVFLALLPLRSKRYNGQTWGLICAFIFITAFAAQTGIRETHLELKKRSQVWLAQWIQQRTNPLKSSTAVGQIGRLKTSDKILYRIPPPVDQPMPSYLQEAVYDLVSGTNWSVLETQFIEIEHFDDFIWDVGEHSTEDAQLDIYHEFHREKEVVPLPIGATRIQDLPAVDIQVSHYGVVQGTGLVPSPRYQIFYNPATNQTGLPLRSDTLTNENNGNLFRQIVEQNDFDSEKPIQSVNQYFSDFRYSLYQPAHLQSNPLEEFLLRRKSGHCEFFATTTVMLLREMGIPARYVTGYAIQEYDSLLDMFVVRQRHAHAWAIAFIDGKWQVVDTTPTIWAQTESEQATLLQPALDLFSNVTFIVQVWWNKQKLEDYEHYLFILGVLLALVLLWRISRGEQVIILKETKADESEGLNPPPKSPLLEIEQTLAEQGFVREPGELFPEWFRRIDKSELLGLLPLHNKLRFHPHGLSENQLRVLESQVRTETLRLKQEFLTTKAQ